MSKRRWDKRKGGCWSEWGAPAMVISWSNRMAAQPSDRLFRLRGMAWREAGPLTTPLPELPGTLPLCHVSSLSTPRLSQ